MMEFIDVRTIMWLLVLGNCTAFVFMLIFYLRSRHVNERTIAGYQMIARLLHAFAYICFMGRGSFPEWLSVNIGNIMFFIGFYFEAQCMLYIIREQKRWQTLTLQGILLGTIVLFNIWEYLSPANGMRVAIASICVFVLMLFPTIRMLFSRESSTFTRSTALLNIFFLSLLLPRAWYSVRYQNVEILTTNTVQVLTFTALLLLLIYSLPSYILIIKEYTDDALYILATTDSLTGATNRHAFLDAAEHIFNNHRRQKTPLSVLFIDIDHFKRVNDLYGHKFGDKTLARFSGIIDQCLRNNDLSCRYGGEEFVALLTRADKEAARLVAERIMEEVHNTVFPENPGFRFTVSIGVTTAIPRGKMLFEELIARADEAMYEAKRDGRDRVEYREMAR